MLGADLPIVLSVPKAARLLGISKDLAYELVRQGELPAIDLGRRRVVVPTRRLLEYVESDAAGAGSRRARSL
jgi:excisionase family DNA binding protein